MFLMNENSTSGYKKGKLACMTQLSDSLNLLPSPLNFLNIDQIWLMWRVQIKGQFQMTNGFIIKEQGFNPLVYFLTAGCLVIRSLV